MILLIFSTLALTLISLWLANELLNANKALQEEKEASEMRRKWVDSYWQYYCEALERNRQLNVLYEGKTILAESLDERVKELSDEIERQDERIHILKRELENEFEWSMLYSESVDKYARLHDEALKESVRLEGELEQTQETLNMLEYGYLLLQDENKQLKTDLKYYREKYEDPID